MVFHNLDADILAHAIMQLRRVLVTKMSSNFYITLLAQFSYNYRVTCEIKYYAKKSVNC